ncbi:MAG TPA: hypothetical protein VLK85_14335 [Ramlibacter sp.]|nr:hypothetical protein [Ramlibacter sp.]
MQYQPNGNLPEPEKAKTLVFEHGGRKVLAMGSVAYATPADRGHVIVTGSHGGRSAGEYAARVAPLAAVANDAGMGKNQAGIAGLRALDSRRIIGIGVSHTSARIGEGLDGWEHGRVSYVNETGARAGVHEGALLREALEALLRRSPLDTMIAPEDGGEWVAGSMRREIVLEDSGLRVLALDSASLLQPQDEGQIVIAAGNGGLESGMLTRRFRCALAAFNDAGIGKDGAGVAGLGVLDQAGLPGLGVSHLSAEISDGMDTWNHGVISTVNEAAAARGIRVGESVQAAVQRLLRDR